MRIVELATWIAAGLAVIAAALAGWQLRRARRRAREAEQYANRIHKLASEVESHAEQTKLAAQNASSQARWAWEQVKLTASQLAQARAEHRASGAAEQWEWAYALTGNARELVDASQELIRVALDANIAPHYRMAAERHYRQTAERWQETMTKALARSTPTLEVQHQVLTFAQVQHRLHGQVGVLLRATETGTLSDGDSLTKEVLETGQELENVRRHLQRTLSTTLASNHLAGAGSTLNTRASQQVGKPNRRQLQADAQSPTQHVRGSLESDKTGHTTGRAGPGRAGGLPDPGGPAGGPPSAGPVAGLMMAPSPNDRPQ
jgi:hypothetical protein